MPWAFEEIVSDWLGGQKNYQFSPEDVTQAFADAERIRGREWVEGKRSSGFIPFFKIYSFGKGVQAIDGAAGAENLLRKLHMENATAESELMAISLLRARRSFVEVEIEPTTMVGKHERRPDFRIRESAQPWTYVEVTQLNVSEASERIESLARRISDRVTSILRPFLLEIVFWREPTENEESEVIGKACEACRVAEPCTVDIGDLALLTLTAGDPAVISPSTLQDVDQTRIGFSQFVLQPNEPKRQVIVRVPFADERAEQILSSEAKQLPKNQSGLVMVDVTRQQTTFGSWPELIARRFTPQQHTRVGGVLLFATSAWITREGPIWLSRLMLIPNVHARVCLPNWLPEVAQETNGYSTSELKRCGAPVQRPW